MRRAAIALLTLIIGSTANAQIPRDTEVYRCPGDVYQPTPCKHGRQLELDPQQNIMDPERRRPTGKYDGDGPSVLLIPMEPSKAESKIKREPSRTVIIRRTTTTTRSAPPPAGNRRSR